MSQHSYTRCWLHLIWATLNHQKLLSPEACKKLYRYFSEYAPTKDIYLKAHYVNPDHVHHRIKTFSEEYEEFIKRYGLSLSTAQKNR